MSLHCRKCVHFLFIMVMIAFLLWGCTTADEELVEPDEEVEEVAGESDIKLAAILSGPIQDADFNTLAYIAIQEVHNKLNIDVSYSERVAVPDAGRVMSEYIDNGYNVIFVHGNQFNQAALELGPSNPNVVFIVEVDIVPGEEEMLPNFWYLDRNYAPGFYVLGAAAALATETGNIGYVGGLELPFTKSELNAMQQAIDDLESEASIQYLFTGDFFDTLEGRRVTESLIAIDCDVIISSLSLGNFGLFTAVQEADHKVLVATKYTDRLSHIPNSFLTADLFDFSIPLLEVIGKIGDGEKGGYLLLEYGPEKPRWTQFPLMNVTEEINSQVQEIAGKVASGEIDVIRKFDEIDVR